VVDLSSSFDFYYCAYVYACDFTDDLEISASDV